LPIEREKISELLSYGYSDVFRHLYPEQIDTYSWWSYRAGARPRNVGWRIDYFVVNNDFLEKVSDLRYMNEVMGSDHCPVQIILK
jgi:exodeoxyribonuclease-3